MASRGLIAQYVAYDLISRRKPLTPALEPLFPGTDAP